MPVVKYPVGAEQASGKFRNSIVYYQWGSLPIARQLVTPRNPQTEAQQLIRAILVANAAAYKTLTQAQIASWGLFADNFTFRTLGMPYKPSGINAFVLINFFRIYHSQARLDDPPLFSVLPPPLDVGPLKWDAALEKLHTTVAYTPGDYEATDYWHVELTDQTTYSRRAFKRDFRIQGFTLIDLTSPQDVETDATWSVAVGQKHRVRVRAVNTEGIPGPYFSKLMTVEATA